MADLENKMLIDSYWPEYEDEPELEDPWEVFCRKADEAYDLTVTFYRRRKQWRKRKNLNK